MYTRQDYMDKKCTHRQYYAQFVDDRVKQRVLAIFSKEQLTKAFQEDKHFNTSYTPLSKWDTAGYEPFPVADDLKKYDDFLTQAGIVCILKEAAEQIIEEEQDSFGTNQ